MDAFTPAQTTELITRVGAKKAKMSPFKLFCSSILAGMLLCSGAALALTAETAPWYQTNAPGLIKVLGAFFFPVGLVMIVLTGADLITSNMMFMANALLARRCSIVELALNWVITFLGNLGGSLFFTLILTGYGGAFSTGAYKEFAMSFATTKAVTPEWYQIFLRGIGCNWLVCLAVFLGISSRENVSKVMGIWIPVFTFVALGFDHVVANMFFIPIGIFLHTPKLTVGYYIWKSMIPSAIGNIVGAVLFVSCAYWYLYLTGPGGVTIHFDTGSANTAIAEAGGPIDPFSRRGTQATIDGTSPNGSLSKLPDSTSDAKSGLAEELNAAKFGAPEKRDSAA